MTVRAHDVTSTGFMTIFGEFIACMSSFEW